MAVVLYRVDERLIHGQVVVGWGTQLHPERIVVVDDDLARSPWEQELYALGLPPDIAADFLSVAEARAALDRLQSAPERAFVLTRDVGTMLRLARGGTLRRRDVNIGGIHHAPGRRQVLPYVFLSAEEETALRGLGEEGVQVTARDLPAARGVDLAPFLDGGAGA